MWMDVRDLQHFYSQDVGRRMAQAVVQELESVCPVKKGERVLAYGYGTPYLDVIRGSQNGREAFLGAVMPAPQGVVRWPRSDGERQGGRQGKSYPDRYSCTVLAMEDHWPVASGVCDRVLLIHSFEFFEDPAVALGEAWRILRASGKLILVVPSHINLLPHVRDTPFHQGKSYTLSHLTDLLGSFSFKVEAKTGASIWSRGAESTQEKHHFLSYSTSIISALETWGQGWLPQGCGALILCASKQICAPIGGCGFFHSQPVLESA